MTDNELVLLVSELAQEINKEDSIDFADISISEKEAFDLMSNQIVEMFKKTEETANERITMLSTIVKLTVENFALNLRLLRVKK